MADSLYGPQNGLIESPYTIKQDSYRSKLLKEMAGKIMENYEVWWTHHISQVYRISNVRKGRQWNM
jgi:hypothetical protein